MPRRPRRNSERVPIEAIDTSDGASGLELLGREPPRLSDAQPDRSYGLSGFRRAAAAANACGSDQSEEGKRSENTHCVSARQRRARSDGAEVESHRFHCAAASVQGCPLTDVDG